MGMSVSQINAPHVGLVVVVGVVSVVELDEVLVVTSSVPPLVVVPGAEVAVMPAVPLMDSAVVPV
jgi:hypothetical protein